MLEKPLNSNPFECQDSLTLEGAEVSAIIGICPQERETPQRLGLSLYMTFDARSAAASGRVEDGIDYVKVMGDVRFLLEKGKFHLIETAAECIAQYLLMRELRCQSVRVCLRKLQVLLSKGTPSIQIARNRSDRIVEKMETAFGSLEKIFNWPESVLYRIKLSPNRSVGIPYGEHEECDLVLSEGLTVSGQLTQMGMGLTWKTENDKNLKTRNYKNPTAQLQYLTTIRPLKHHSHFTSGESESLIEPTESANYYEGMPAHYTSI